MNRLRNAKKRIEAFFAAHVADGKHVNQEPDERDKERVCAA
jgi:hypothetical protein